MHAAMFGFDSVLLLPEGGGGGREVEEKKNVQTQLLILADVFCVHNEIILWSCEIAVVCLHSQDINVIRSINKTFSAANHYISIYVYCS